MYQVSASLIYQSVSSISPTWRPNQIQCNNKVTCALVFLDGDWFLYAENKERRWWSASKVSMLNQSSFLVNLWSVFNGTQILSLERELGINNGVHPTLVNEVISYTFSLWFGKWACTNRGHTQTLMKTKGICPYKTRKLRTCGHCALAHWIQSSSYLKLLKAWIQQLRFQDLSLGFSHPNSEAKR